MKTCSFLVEISAAGFSLGNQGSKSCKCNSDASFYIAIKAAKQFENGGNFSEVVTTPLRSPYFPRSIYQISKNKLIQPFLIYLWAQNIEIKLPFLKLISLKIKDCFQNDIFKRNYGLNLIELKNLFW